MTEAEFLERIDRHIALANEHMARTGEHIARGNEIMARNNELFPGVIDALDRNAEAFHRNVAAFEGNQRFLRGLTEHHERATRRMIAEIKDLSDLTRKQTEGLMRVLDRLDDIGPQPAT